MNNYNDLTINLKSYTELSLKIDQMNKMLSKLRAEKSELEQKALNEITRLNLEDKKMKIENTHFFLGYSKQSPLLNLGLIESVGERVIGKQQTLKLVDEIKKYREANVKKTPSLKKKNIRKQNIILYLNMDRIKKEDIQYWLSTRVTEDNIIFDYILDLKDSLVRQLNANDIKLKYDEDVFTMNLIYYLYNNSYIN